LFLQFHSLYKLISAVSKFLSSFSDCTIRSISLLQPPSVP
jgi:hypothetical protein